MAFNISNRVCTHLALTAASCLLAQKAFASGSLIANFNVSGVVPTVPSWYDNGNLINTPSNNPNLTIGFTFGAGALAIPDSNGNFTTDTRYEALSNPNALIATFTSFMVTLPSSCKIGSATTTDGTHSVDTSMTMVIAGNTPHASGTSTVTSAEITALNDTLSSVPGATSGAQVYLSLAHLQPLTGSTGAVSCSSPGNFTVTF